MTEPITIEQYHEAYYQIRQYEYQQMKPGRPLLRLLSIVDASNSLRYQIERLIDFCVGKNIILLPSSDDVTDVYFAAYFSSEDLLDADYWWGRSFKNKVVEELANAFKKSNCAFGEKIYTPLPMRSLVDDRCRRDRDLVQINNYKHRNISLDHEELNFEPNVCNLELNGPAITQLQFDEAIICYYKFEEQRLNGGKVLLNQLQKLGASVRLMNGIVNTLETYVWPGLIPYNYTRDVTDVFFASYFTSEDLLKIRNFGIMSVNEFKKIMAQNGTPFK